MAVGRQDDTVIVRWMPGESDGVDGTGATASIPVSEDAEDQTAASGVRTFFDSRVDAQLARITALGARLVASGVLPTSV